MFKTMRFCGFYVLCYNEKDYMEKQGETKKYGPYRSVENAFDKKEDEEKKRTWYFVEVVEKVIITE